MSVWFHDQGVLLQVNTGITLQITSWHNTDIHTNTVRTNFNHFSTLPQNLVLLWWILFEKYFFKHSNPISSLVSEIKSGVRGSYAAEKVGTLKVKQWPKEHSASSELQWIWCSPDQQTTGHTHQTQREQNFAWKTENSAQKGSHVEKLAPIHTSLWNSQDEQFAYHTFH